MHTCITAIRRETSCGARSSRSTGPIRCSRTSASALPTSPIPITRVESLFTSFTCTEISGPAFRVLLGPVSESRLCWIGKGEHHFGIHPQGLQKPGQKLALDPLIQSEQRWNTDGRLQDPAQWNEERLLDAAARQIADRRPITRDFQRGAQTACV